MEHLQETWFKEYQSNASALRVANATVEKGTAYLYRVGTFHFETGFACLASAQGCDWVSLFQRAAEIYHLSLDKDDCQNRQEYPYNLGRLHQDLYFCQWLLDQPADPNLLLTSAHWYVDGLWSKPQQPIENFAFLIQDYLLVSVENRLAELWALLEQKSDLQKAPSEIRLWWQVSNLLRELGQSAKVEDFDEVYRDYVKDRWKDGPTRKIPSFYLTLAKLLLDKFGYPGSPQESILHIAVRAWEKPS